MTTEFNLSEKIDYGVMTGIRKEDVKEFIRLLKEKFLIHQEGTDCLICGNRAIPITLTNVNEIIDKIAGDKLNGVN